MNTGSISATLTIIGLLASTQTLASENAHWGYTGSNGPEHWGELSPEYVTCSSGKNQSPINLTRMIEGDLPELAFSYKPGGHEVLNNGHAIQINYVPGSTMIAEEKAFELKQFHYHSPSENTIEGQSFPLEAHFVHADKDGNLAVITVMYELGEHNEELEKAWSKMPKKAGHKKTLSEVMDANIMIPRNRDYYRFNGSLTTPPCSEGVSWFVMKSFQTASREQIEKFTHVMHHDNNRSIQATNARVVIQ